MTATLRALPRWDTSVLYPGLDSPEFTQGFQDAVRQIDDLAALFDAHGVGQQEPAPLDDATVRAAEEVLARYNAVLRTVRTLGSYIRCFVSTDSRDDVAQARLSELQQHMVRLSQLGTRFVAWIGSLDVAALIAGSEVAQDHAFALRHAQAGARHLMSPAEEALAAELELSSGTAWNKLHGRLTSQLDVPFDRDGKTERLPMSAIRNLALDPDRATRRRAYEAEVETWRQHAVPLAAALNSIKGEVNTLSARRAWPSPLDEALFDNHIDRATLEAMMQAARESFPDFRRYLRAKARALGVPALAWYDLFAPVGVATDVWDYARGAAFVTEQFSTFSEKLRALAERAFRDGWIDAEPRAGKEGGAFCMWLRGDESRVLANYTSSFESVTTLAHELGHAYHNLNLAGRTMLQRATPMALAETASIFCETLVTQARLRHAGEQERLVLLESSIQGSCQVVVDITSRFLFEQRVFELRRAHELSVDDLNGLMLQAQRETYGDGLDQSTLHPYMWAVKSHYYSTARSYYNYPYMFGLLFGLGLFARYREEPGAFVVTYDDLLSSTGLDDAATLAGRFGIDIRTPAFWRSSLDVIRADIDRFEALVDAGGPHGS